MLGALRRERGEAYRAAPLLAERAALGAGLAGWEPTGFTAKPSPPERLTS